MQLTMHYSEIHFTELIFQKYPYDFFLLQFDTLFMKKELSQVALKVKEVCHLLTLAQPAYIKMQVTVGMVGI